MIQKPISDIAIEDLQRLVTNGVAESRTLEYKQTLPGGTDTEKKEFLADVSAFANAIGGDLVYGVTEARDENNKTTGVAESVDGLAQVNADAETRRLDNMLRDGIQPRIAGVQFRTVDGGAKGPVLIIRIPRSYAGPHMVVFQQHGRFYARNAAGKNALDVFELRQAFLGSGSVAERARSFRAERIGRLGAGETPAPLTGDRLVCVHIVPHAALAGGTDIDILLAADAYDYIRPFYGSDNIARSFNLDGLLTWRPSRDEASLAYLQVFRDGILESATSALVSDYGRHELTLPSLTFAESLAEFLKRARGLMKKLDVNAPASLLVSLLNVRGVTLGISDNLRFFGDVNPRPFDRDHLLLRELTLMDWDGEPMTLLKPLLTELWQAAGISRCHDYDDAGNWKPRRH